jgi:hypothetical protein
MSLELELILASNKVGMVYCNDELITLHVSLL